MKRVKKRHIKFGGGKIIVSRRQYVSKSWQKKRRKNNELALPVFIWPGKTKEIGISFTRRRKDARKAKTGFKLNLLLNLNLKTTAPLLLMLAGLSGLIYFSDQNADASSLEARTSVIEPVEEKKIKDEPYNLAYSEPRSIKVAARQINAQIKPVGQNPDKSMEVPGLFENKAGWYKLGPSPGEIGPAVISGHVDNYKGPSVFYNLHELKAGDQIEVARKDGKIAKFNVTAIEQYSQANFPTKKVYGNIDHAGLRLITCGGTFDKNTGQYSKNTVVYAKLIEPES